MKAIETAYKGYRFRSRLEARWAVFFDALGIEWQYEVEGYELPSGARYLPDFVLRLRDLGDVHAEIKPGPGSKEADWAKAKEFSRAGKNILLLAGVPTPMRHTLCLNKDTAEGLSALGAWVHRDGPCVAVMATFCARGVELTSIADGIWHAPQIGPEFRAAVTAARGARFEYGESGAWRK